MAGSRQREMALTTLAILGVLLAGLSLIYSFPAWVNFSLFLIFGIAFFLTETFLPKWLNQNSVASYGATFTARLKTNAVATINVTFQWPENYDPKNAKQRLYLRASSAIATRFSSLSEPLKHSALRSFILDAVKDESKSLGLPSIEVLVHDVEVKGNVVKPGRGILLGGS